MNGLQLLPMFMIGLLGGVHCVGMCGGIVSAFSMAPVPVRLSRALPVAVMGSVLPTAKTALTDDVLRVLAYNAGRIGSYALAGAIAGGIAQGLNTLPAMAAWQTVLYAMANLMLVALGLYLMNFWHGLTFLEKGGRVIWRRIQPLTRHLLPVDSLPKAFALGSLWGWVPCGMVYSVLLTALLSGSAVHGAAVMFAFGLGTLPLLVTMGLLGARLRGWLAQRRVRIASGLIVLAFGLLGLWRAAHGMAPAWFDVFCIAPHASAGAVQ